MLLHGRLQNIQVIWQYLNWASINDMQRSFFCFIDKYLASRDKALSLLFALRHILVMWSSDFNPLSVVMPNNLTWFFPQTWVSPTFSHKCSKLWPVIRNSHFSVFHIIVAKPLYCQLKAFLYLLYNTFKELSHTLGVVLSA